ncbi:MAG: AmmeMemoRadiSam system protein B [Candidatus Omnitrophica bacterium]|nr:AmmeMemoRadiSam system protein B [Candidatus Omnitrophota bacterium]
MERSRVRQPAFAGAFYPGSRSELNAEIKRLLDPEAKKRDCIACLMPHAGYPYSGPVAGATISCVEVKPTVLLIGPKHRALGNSNFSLMSAGSWKTPLGEVSIDEDLAQALMASSKYLEEDELPHVQEHSLEVEVPFLQYLRPDVRIVPLAVSSPDAGSLKAVGREIGATVSAQGKKGEVLILASSDMNHFEPQDVAKKKDAYALDALLALDEDGLIKAVKQHDISMCGYEPAAIMIAAAKALGAQKAQLVRYQTSGDVTGDYSEVVAYAGVIIY